MRPSQIGGDRPLRIVIVSSCVAPWGGSEELWFETACALRGKGHQVDVLKTNVDPSLKRIRELRAIGCRVHDLHRGGRLLVWYAAATPWLGRVTAYLQMLMAGPHLRFPRRADLAIVSQGVNFDGVDFARLSERVGVPYLLVSQKASPLLWPPDANRAYVRRVHERARRTVFVSEHNRSLTRLQLDAELPRSLVLGNPLLAGRDGPFPWPEEGAGGLRLACVGRAFVLEKGQDLLLCALARERWRDREVQVSVFGDGVNREGLEGMARRLGLQRVTFHGHLADVEAVWRDHHALVLPSRAEGLSLAVQEAMACGRVPIVTNAGGSTELVEDNITGFVIDGASENAIDSTLERAWQQRGEWRTIGLRAAERVTKLLQARGPAPLASLALLELGVG